VRQISDRRRRRSGHRPWFDLDQLADRARVDRQVGRRRCIGAGTGRRARIRNHRGELRLKAAPVSLRPHRFFRLLTVVWVCSLLTIGYAVAPVLFTSLDRMTAGAVAAQLFRIEGLLGVVCGVLLLGLANVLVRRGSHEYRRLRWLIVGML